MSEYDGSIIIDSHIDTSGFEKDANKISKDMKDLSDKIKNGFDNKLSLDDMAKLPKSFRDIYVSANNARESISYLGKELDNSLKYSEYEYTTLYKMFQNLENSLTKYKAKLDILNNTKFISKESLDDVLKANEELKKTSDRLENVKRISSSLGGKTSAVDLSKLTEGMSRGAKKAEIDIANVKNRMINLSEDIISGVDKMNKVELDALISKFERLNRTLTVLNSTKVDPKISVKDVDNIEPKVNKLNSAIATAGNALKGLGNGFKSLGETASKAFSKIRDGASKIPNVLSPIGNLLNKMINIAKFQVLRQVVRTVINEVKKSFVDLATYSKPFNNSMQSVVDSFKNFANAIMNIFAPVMSALAPIISTITNMLTGLANNIAFVTNALFGNGQTAIIADTSFQGYSKSLNQTSKESKKAKKNSDELFKGLAKFDKLDILNKKKKDSGIGGAVSEVPKAMKMFKEVKIPDNFKKIAEEIKKTFEPLGEFFSRIADTFNTNFVQPILYYWDNNFVPTFSENFNNFASNFNSEPLENALSGLFSALEKLAELSLEQFNWSMQNIIFPLLNWSGEFLIPEAIELLTSSVNLLNAAWDASKDAFKEVFEEYIKPVAQEIGKIIIKIIAKIKVWLDKITAWIKEHPEDFKKIVKFILILSTKLLELIVVIKLVSSAIALVTSVITICKLAFDLLNPEVLLFKLAIVAIIALGAALIVWGDDIKNALVGCWDAIKKACQSMWDAIVDGASWAWNALLDIIQNHPLIKIINLVIRGVNKGLKGINALVGSSFGEIPEINLSAAKIPRHATGTVVSPNHRYLAMLGDNTREPEVVSPISTMEQAMSNVLARSNGGGNVTLQLDGETFARLITPYMNSENTRLGVSMVSGV